MIERKLSAVTLSVMVGVAAFAASTVHAADADDVKAAVEAYHRAIASLDVSKFDAVWAHDDNVIDREPISRTITVGWEGTRKNFEGLVGATAELSIAQVDGPHVQVEGDLAWSVGVANAQGKLKSGKPQSGDVVEADVFQKRDGRWLLVSHVASFLPPP